MLMCATVGCKPENTVGWRAMNKTPSRPVVTEKDVKYEERALAWIIAG